MWLKFVQVEGLENAENPLVVTEFRLIKNDGAKSAIKTRLPYWFVFERVLFFFGFGGVFFFRALFTPPFFWRKLFLIFQPKSKIYTHYLLIFVHVLIAPYLVFKLPLFSKTFWGWYFCAFFPASFFFISSSLLISLFTILCLPSHRGLNLYAKF